MINTFTQAMAALNDKRDTFSREYLQWLRFLVDRVNADASLAAVLDDLAALSVVGNPTNAAADASAITAGTDGHALRRSGTALGFGTLAIGAFADAVITFAKLQNFDALSVLGRSANSSGVGDEIAAGTDGHVLRRSGTTLGFGKILTNFITGTATNDSAAAGDIGEYQSASATGVGSWSSGVSKDITSKSLTAGDWMVSGIGRWAGGAITGSGWSLSISTTSATLGGTDTRAESTEMPTAAYSPVQTTPPVRVSLASTTTVYLVGSITFSGGTPSADGYIHAWRAR